MCDSVRAVRHGQYDILKMTDEDTFCFRNTIHELINCDLLIVFVSSCQNCFQAYVSSTKLRRSITALRKVKKEHLIISLRRKHLMPSFRKSMGLLAHEIEGRSLSSARLDLWASTERGINFFQFLLLFFPLSRFFVSSPEIIAGEAFAGLQLSDRRSWMFSTLNDWRSDEQLS